MSPGEIFLWEFMGTAMLTLLGCGVVANNVLRRSLGHNGGWLLVNFGWGFAVFAGASIAAPSGAHINPAVTLGLAVNGQVSWSQVPFYIVAQVLGGILGALLCWAAYKLQFDTHDAPGETLGIFSTGPTVPSAPWNLVTEIIGTFVLVFWIIQNPSAEVGQAGVPEFGNAALGYAAVTFIVIGIGNSLGGPTGYAINPARDLGPRIAYALLPIRGKGSANWGYSWVPVAGPIAGGVLAGLLALALPAS
ncbi:glycerol uptake facilitator protein [Saccharopolyspora erythraea NRRL 2338]|uniref:Glycerol uptake facilitator protein n=2 Tax=Saccharopolyspora erythraea TaxID=1836 RepID=A4FNR1_SACEN|nr:MIP/aquaporin family protein [Saccharopolyspora erythraea]EQD85016.1 glycerol transporter [Saccharopolyspora erythraea D]PFG99325.1 glycerol uptake facilitator protein [Saccharopolyspora erythraea NRRL 2338]QRK89257.1 aquaporin family protein [Saccharopolyspora erythraea]CAM05686.1 glycerol uptake facilitator protein [Saccharopolyspora erythraea NRRL 2338]